MSIVQQAFSLATGFAIHNGVLLDLRSPVFSGKLRSQIVRGRYEGNEARAAKSLVETGQAILEIGAGCGFISSYISKLGRNNTIHCVEADPRLIPVIKRQHQLNRVSAHVHNELLAKEPGEADFFIHADFWASRASPADGTTKVTVKRTCFTTRLQEWRPDCLIMDIEGGELDLLEIGLPEFVRTLIVETHPGVYGLEGVRRVMDRISGLGFAYASQGSCSNVLSYRRI